MTPLLGVAFALAAPLAAVIGPRGAVAVGATCRLATRFLLLWGTSLRTMQLMQVGRTDALLWALRV